MVVGTRSRPRGPETKGSLGTSNKYTPNKERHGGKHRQNDVNHKGEETGVKIKQEIIQDNLQKDDDNIILVRKGKTNRDPIEVIDTKSVEGLVAFDIKHYDLRGIIL